MIMLLQITKFRTSSATPWLTFEIKKLKSKRYHRTEVTNSSDKFDSLTSPYIEWISLTLIIEICEIT